MHIYDVLKLLLISMIPVIEQKGAIPIGIQLGIPVWEVYLITLLGVMIPAPFIVLLFKETMYLMKRIKIFKKIALKIETITMKKSKLVRKLEYIGLIIFIAIPLPGTGVWTGSAIAGLLQLNFFKSMLAILTGAAISGYIIIRLTQGITMLL